MKKLSLIFAGILFVITGMAQSFSINTDGSTANASAILDVKSTTKGMLVPRMNKTEKNAIASPATGLLIFQTTPDSIGFHYYNGIAWVWLEVLANAGWKTTGNAGTDTAINFIGTTDAMPLRFRQNGAYLAQWDLNNGNYYIGAGAGKTKRNTVTGNIAIGDSAFSFPITSSGTSNNIAIGFKALKSHKTYQGGNIAIGAFALENDTSNAGIFNNHAIGFKAMQQMKNGQLNSAFGAEVYDAATFGSGNTVIGGRGLHTLNSGDDNTSLGIMTAGLLNDGTGNSFLGARTATSVTTNLTNATAIGYKAQVDTSNAMVLGSINGVNNATANVNIAIGTTKPKAALHVSRGSSGNIFTMPSNRISLFEDNSSNYIQLLSPDANETGILAGNSSTLIKSSIVFSADSAVLIRTGGNNTRIFAAKSGLVGIGNINPQSRLHVSNGTTAGAVYTFAVQVLESNSASFLQLMNPSVNASGIISGTELTSARSSISFNADSSIAFNSPSFSSRMTVKNDGDILIPGLLGVGNTSPQTKFHVSRGTVPGAVYFTPATTIFESSNTNFLQLMNPSTAIASIISGTDLSNNRSGINFNPDSSLSFAAGGFLTRVMILKNGNTGINTPTPAAILDANGTFKLGNAGTVNSAIIKNTVTIDVGSVAANNELDVVTAVANVSTTGAVSISPTINLPNGIIIAWSRVSSAGNITTRYRNLTGSAIDPPSISYIIAVIQ